MINHFEQTADWLEKESKKLRKSLKSAPKSKRGPIEKRLREIQGRMQFFLREIDKIVE